MHAGSLRDGLILSAHWQGDETWLDVDYAEPRALFAGFLLRRVRRGAALPHTEVDRVGIGGTV